MPLETTGHAHGHICFFKSCPYWDCKRAQKQAVKYGFTEDGRIAKEHQTKKGFPWENAA